MRIILALVLFCLSVPISAHTVISRIEDIDYPDSMSEDILVFLSTGQVGKVSHSFINLLDEIHDAKANQSWLKITLNKSREITDVEITQAPEDSSLKSAEAIQEFIPSVLKSPDWALRYFRESRIKHKESQCFNRAHVWSYEWYKKRQFYSSKIFLFFTRKFIREHKFEWWFHIAPYVHVAYGSEIKERVMDMKYTRQPSTVVDWVKHFIKVDDPKCITVKTYSDYANFPENGNCYVMRASMYYYWPLDLEKEEQNGTIKANWLDEEVKTAYLEAFDIVKK